MFQHEKTVVTKFELHLPESADKISGSCSVNASVGIPKSITEDSVIWCKVNVKATNNKSEIDTLVVTAMSMFRITDHTVSVHDIQEHAADECIPVALKEVSEKIENATELLCGYAITLPLADDM